MSIDCEEQNLRPLPFRVSGVTKPGSEPPPRHSVGIDKTIQQRKEQPHEASDQTKDQQIESSRRNNVRTAPAKAPPSSVAPDPSNVGKGIQHRNSTQQLQQPEQIRIITLNVWGLRASGKLETLKTFLRDFDAHVALITETRLLGPENKKLNRL